MEGDGDGVGNSFFNVQKMAICGTFCYTGSPWFIVVVGLSTEILLPLVLTGPGALISTYTEGGKATPAVLK